MLALDPVRHAAEMLVRGLEARVMVALTAKLGPYWVVDDLVDRVQLEIVEFMHYGQTDVVLRLDGELILQYTPRIEVAR